MDTHIQTDEEIRELSIKAYDKMAYYLAARDHSLKELYQKLSKNFPQDIVNLTLDKAIDQGLISSPKEMAAKTAQMLHRKNKGYYYIHNYLKKKGLPEVERDEEIEIDKACAIINGYFTGENSLSYEQKQKAIRLLKNRGFDNDTIKKAIYEIF